MNNPINVVRNRAQQKQLTEFLTACDLDFSPPLSERQNISQYADRIFSRAERFEHWNQNVLVGLVAMYCMTPPGAPAFVTNVSVRHDHQGRGVANALLNAAIEHARASGLKAVALEVDKNATAARRLYAKHGFVQYGSQGATLLLHATL